MESVYKKVAAAMLLFSSLIAMNNANAVNWLMLQGVTEDPYPLVWGFLQPSYFHTAGSVLPEGAWKGQRALSNVMQPDLSSSQVFQVQRARIGVRGASPENENISYFLLAEYGNNGITQPGGGAGRVTLTDATLTFSQFKSARIRVGQMKVPMSEEVYQGILAINYINLTNIANQQLIERPMWTDGNAPCLIDNPASELYLRYCNTDALGQFRTAAVAGRDTGIQVFGSFQKDDWEHSYAVLVGQGGANKDNRNDSLDRTIYLSTEKIFEGLKAFRQGYKLYAWRTSGKRTLYDSSVLFSGGSSLQEAEREYDRKISGLGGTYFDGKYRFWAEYIKAAGMIFKGSTFGAVPGAVNNNGFMLSSGPVAPGTWVAQFLTAPEGKSDGGYLDFGYRVKPHIELDVRFDWYDRLTDQAPTDEMKFKTWTLGAQYFFSDTTKAIVNYERRSVELPGYPADHIFNKIAGETDDRLSAQVFLMF